MKLRFCVKYLRLNSLTKRDNYHIPWINECLDFFGNAALYTYLDADSGYCKVKIEDEDKSEISFVFHAGS